MNNFVVSARKYRPTTFQTVIGQSHITSTLKNAINRDQLAHAYLFCGPRGVGKTTCARIFAKTINCLAPVEKEACGECESCLAFDEGRSFNIHELDAASNNSVDDIRSLTEQVRIPPQIGRYSVYIIDEVHMLSASAFNAFLKTLEEPPMHAVFILATTEKHKIIPTILSRCQIFDFNRIRVEDGVFYLKYIAEKEGITADDESLHLISQKADGGMRDALSMFDKAVSFCGTNLSFKDVAKTLNILDYDTYFDITSAIIDGDYQTTLILFDEVLRGGFSGQLFISGLGNHFRDMLMCKTPQTIKLLEVTGSLMEKYRLQGAKCDASSMFSAIALLTEIDGTLRSATNQRLNIEIGLMKLCGLGKKKTSDECSVESLQLPELREEVKRPIQKSSEIKTKVEPVQQTVESKIVAKSEVIVEVVVEEQKEVKVSENIEKIKEKVIDTESKKVPLPTVNVFSQSISGNSIASILNPTKLGEGGKAVTPETVVSVDADAQQKIDKFRERFLKNLNVERPSLTMVFSEMSVVNNIVKINVPHSTMYEDIMRNKIDILTILASSTGVKGFIDLIVNIKEEDLSRRIPIKVEDKLKFLIEKNPNIAHMRKVLSLELD